MKKLYTFLVLLLSLATFAQAPDGFNYQATVRNSAGTLITNKAVSFTFSIIKGSVTGTTVYSETRTASTDDLGSVNLVVGQGIPTAGTFSTIDWSNGSYFLSIGLDTGSGNVAMGTTQLLSVPFALYAKSSKNPGRPSILLTGDITDAQAAAMIASQVGPNTENVYITNTTQLTSVDLSSITTLANLSVNGNTALTNVNLSGVTTLISNFSVSQNPALVSLSMAALTNAYGGLNVGQNNALTTLSFPSLTSGSVNINGNAALTSASLPAFSSSTISINNNRVLTAITVATLKTDASSNYINIDFSGNALSSSQINTLLHQMAGLTLAPNSSGNIYLQSQYPPAPPTGDDASADLQTLSNNRINVNVDDAPANLVLTIKDPATGNTISGATVKLYSIAPYYYGVPPTLLKTSTSDANGVVTFELSDQQNQSQYGFTATIDCRYSREGGVPTPVYQQIIAGQTIPMDVNLQSYLPFNVVTTTANKYSVSIATAANPTEPFYSGQYIDATTPFQAGGSLGDYVLTMTKWVNGNPSTVPADTTTKNFTVTCTTTQVSIP